MRDLESAHAGASRRPALSVVRELPAGPALPALRALLAGGALILAGVTIGCESQSAPPSAAGATPANAYFIGPQPGADRALPPPTNPYASDRTVLTEGRHLFTAFNCAGCHGDHGGGGMGPSLRDSTWLYGGEPGSIFASITEGRQHGMPAWGAKVPREQIWKIVTYIKSMRTAEEPDAPR